MEVNSVFLVTNLFNGQMHRITVEGDAKTTYPFLRKEYPNKQKDFYKFVLEGFELNGNYHPLDTRSNYRL